MNIFQLDDPAGCKAGVSAHWADIANAMYPVFLEGNSICSQLSVCHVREWTCDECVSVVGHLSLIISSSAESVVAFLKVGHVISWEPLPFYSRELTTVALAGMKPPAKG